MDVNLVDSTDSITAVSCLWGGHCNRLRYCQIDIATGPCPQVELSVSIAAGPCRVRMLLLALILGRFEFGIDRWYWCLLARLETCCIRIQLAK